MFMIEPKSISIVPNWFHPNDSLPPPYKPVICLEVVFNANVVNYDIVL